MDTGALSLDQAPPLGIPALFFACVPVAMIATGVLLVLGGSGPSSVWLPSTIAVTHLLTLGVLGMAMFGAMVQMTPVVAGRAVPGVRSAYVVWALLLGGAAALVAGIGLHVPAVLGASLLALAAAVLAFSVPVGVALLRAEARDATIVGMRLAVACLAILAAIGVLMGSAYVTSKFSMHRASWMQLHVVFALGGWVGGLIAAVSWQVVPMFYLAPSVPERAQRACLALLSLGLVGASAAHAARLFGLVGPLGWPHATAIAAIPAVVAIGVLHPWTTWRSLSRRRRKRVDPSVLFWRSGLAVAPLASAAMFAGLLGVRGGALLFGWLALWGWSGMIVHGMLNRIVPFLVWFHRFSPLIGVQEVPAMRSMLPDLRVRAGLVAHHVALVLGALAIVTRAGALWAVAGVGVAATGLVLGANLVHVLGQFPARDPGASEARSSAQEDRRLSVAEYDGGRVRREGAVVAQQPHGLR